MLVNTFIDFQRIPPKPQGDGGLDGLSHGQKNAYCCYGPEQQPSPKTTPEQMRSKIVTKFTSDIQRLFELVDGKGNALVHQPNATLRAILGTTRPCIEHIKLIVSVFEDNKILGELTNAFNLAHESSQHECVKKTCTFAVWGPKDVASCLSIDDGALTRVEHPGFTEMWKQVEASSQNPKPVSEAFKEKFDELQGAPQTVQQLRETFERAWSRSVVAEQKTLADFPRVHQKMELVRRIATREALLASSMGSTNAFELILKTHDKLKSHADQLLGTFVPADSLDGFVEGETARLIGECPLDWRSKKGTK